MESGLEHGGIRAARQDAAAIVSAWAANSLHKSAISNRRDFMFSTTFSLHQGFSLRQYFRDTTLA